MCFLRELETAVFVFSFKLAAKYYDNISVIIRELYRGSRRFKIPGMNLKRINVPETNRSYS